MKRRHRHPTGATAVRPCGLRSGWPEFGRSGSIDRMRRASVADELRIEHRRDVASLSPSERVLLALKLGRESVELLRARSGLSMEHARRALERRRQSRRRPSACLEALLA
ncbi:MAG TPA: hypothetical protein VKM54_17900 [Myxococcota bacterium]|nr:hypothetical protein [Myxococcota bacterium]